MFHCCRTTPNCFLELAFMSLCRIQNACLRPVPRQKMTHLHFDVNVTIERHRMGRQKRGSYEKRSAICFDVNTIQPSHAAPIVQWRNEAFTHHPRAFPPSVRRKAQPGSSWLSQASSHRILR